MKQNKHQQQLFWAGWFYPGCLDFLKIIQVVLATAKVASEELCITISKDAERNYLVVIH